MYVYIRKASHQCSTREYNIATIVVLEGHLVEVTS